jgi:PAS domain S-box-containing protein
MDLILLPADGAAGPHLHDLAELVVENAADAIFVMDTEGRTVFANPAAERAFGWLNQELVGLPLHDMVHHHYPDGRPFPMVECPLGKVFTLQTRLEKHEEVFFHRNGQPIHVACSNAPIVRDGRMIGAVLIAVDISERKRIEEHQRVLINELNHRVKNTLATVQSIVAHSLRGATTSSDARSAIEHRLMALSRAHDVLTREFWGGADLSDIVAEAFEPYASDSRRFQRQGPSVRLPPRTALAVAMTLQELCTNAIKYGALSNGTGTIDLRWGTDDTDGGGLWIRWEERGGPPVVPPSKRGFGTRLIERTLAEDLQGTARLDFAPSGVVCTLTSALS